MGQPRSDPFSLPSHNYLPLYAIDADSMSNEA